MPKSTDASDAMARLIEMRKDSLAFLSKAIEG